MTEAETAFDALREGISLREARKTWVENSPGGMACGISEAQAAADERRELERAMEYQRRCESHYGRQVSIRAARAAVRGDLAGDFADLAAGSAAPNALSGTTQEVIEQLRRGHPEWAITWAPEQRRPGPQFGGLAYGPSSIDAIGDETMAAEMIERQHQSRTMA